MKRGTTQLQMFAAAKNLRISDERNLPFRFAENIYLASLLTENHSGAAQVSATSSFTTDELKQARLWYDKWISRSLVSATLPPLHTVAAKGVSRMYRAFAFLKSARTLTDVGARVATMIT